VRGADVQLGGFGLALAVDPTLERKELTTQLGFELTLLCGRQVRWRRHAAGGVR